MINQKISGLRLQQIQKNLGQKKIEAFLITSPANILYYTNFSGSNGQLLITPKKAFFFTDFRYKGLAKKNLPKDIQLKICVLGLVKTVEQLTNANSIKTLGFEQNDLTFGTYQAFQKNIPKLKLVPYSDLCAEPRMIKDDIELILLKKAQNIAEKVFLEVKKNLAVGKSEQELAWEIEKTGHDFGADTISFAPIVGFGPNSAIPHHQNSSKKLKKGDLILIDMGMKYQGYCSDMTRMIFTKKPTKLQHKIYSLVLEAQEKSISKLKAGVKGDEIDGVAREIIKKAGFGETFGHSLGHGIGLEVHEAPNLSQGYGKIIPENTIVTVEPGVYLENNFGVRIEDMLLVKRNKAINLTQIPKKIEDCFRFL